ncbi:MAG: class I SAM-dependent methyltransferase [Nitrospirota bacterium]|nr:class I SAM-dependent methyltransferase [Nitrospirota bacterium]MDE3225715.1 class I SAM-dependent methyltransferase [Nitrospirota bacterium]MDE3241129.1 class I SAM-dependent methyltransferase [Nitrospirota bacterium]
MSDHHGHTLAEMSHGLSVIACEGCGFAHQHPLPSEEEMTAYYATQFYETFSPADWLAKEAAEQSYWRIEHRDRLQAIAELAGMSGGRLLDIGCGAGWLLAYAQEQGWEVLGVEPSHAAWQDASRRVPVLLGTFPHPGIGAHVPFDAVHCKQVLEHVRDPKAFLLEVHGVLKPGGLFAVEVPNDFNPLQRAARQCLDKAPWWISPVHLNYFSFESLVGMLGECGFHVLRREATYPMELFLLQGTDYIGRDEIGRTCHRQRMNLELALEESGCAEIRRSYRAWLAEHSIGREAVVYARRAS